MCRQIRHKIFRYFMYSSPNSNLKRNMSSSLLLKMLRANVPPCYADHHHIMINLHCTVNKNHHYTVYYNDHHLRFLAVYVIDLWWCWWRSYIPTHSIMCLKKVVNIGIGVMSTCLHAC